MVPRWFVTPPNKCTGGALIGHQFGAPGGGHVFGQSIWVSNAFILATVIGLPFGAPCGGALIWACALTGHGHFIRGGFSASAQITFF